MEASSATSSPNWRKEAIVQDSLDWVDDDVVSFSRTTTAAPLPRGAAVVVSGTGTGTTRDVGPGG